MTLPDIPRDAVARRATKWKETSFGRCSVSKKGNLFSEILIFAPHQSLPCVKGGGSAQADSEGLCGKKLRICIGFRRNRHILLQQSLSHAVRMTAPFAQGSLGRSRARRFFDSLKRPSDVAMRCIAGRVKTLPYRIIVRTAVFWGYRAEAYR